MTIAIAVKVNDGLVLAADSASTIMDANGIVHWVYNNANKICNLVKGLPIGFISWGAGSIGISSISTLMKDLRRRLTGEDSNWMHWKIDPDNYAITDVAAHVREFLFDEHYAAVYGGSVSMPELGAYIVGYSSGEVSGEVYQLQIEGNGICNPPALLSAADEPGIWIGWQTTAPFRLVVGFDARLPDIIQRQLSLPQNQLDQLMASIASDLGLQLISAPMPIQDAAELAEFLAETAVKTSHFAPGAATVGGPIELAAITKHEGYKWIKRKYYYSRELNPEVPHVETR